MSPVFRASTLAILAGLARVSIADSPASVDTIRAEHAAYAAAVRSLVVEETVRTHNPRGAAEEAELVNFLNQREAAYRQHVAAELAERDLSRAEQTFLLEQRMRKSGRAELAAEVVPAWRANEHEWTQQRHYYDFVGRRERLEQRDLRDLAEIVRDQGIPDSQLPNVDLSKTFINTRDYSLIVDRDRTNAALLRGSTQGLDERLILLGIVPERLLSGAFTIDVSANPDGATLLQGRVAGAEHPTFEITLRGEEGHRMSRLVQYDDKCEAKYEVLLDDYRRTDSGQVLPFRTRSVRNLGREIGQRTETREVTRIELNSALPADVFQAPRGARLQPLDPAALAAYKARSPASEPG
ncbi:MAG: hypothetical protein HRF50_11885 [Phycisphaerae bacterium]|jgi:hypothetical protein